MFEAFFECVLITSSRYGIKQLNNVAIGGAKYEFTKYLRKRFSQLGQFLDFLFTNPVCNITQQKFLASAQVYAKWKQPASHYTLITILAVATASSFSLCMPAYYGTTSIVYLRRKSVEFTPMWKLKQF